jgi:rRNA processing protein Krr1/Pno1
VCDIKAEECSKWNLGLDADNHCNACFESPKWCTLRAEHVKARAEEQAGRMKGNGDGGAPGPFPRLHPEPGLPGGDDNHSGLPGRGEHNGGPSRGDMVGSDVQGVDGRETLQQLMLRRLEAHRLVVLDAEVAWQQRYMSRTGAAAVGVISSGDGSKAPGGGGGGAVVGKVGGSSGDLDANAGGSGASLRLDDGVKIGSGRGGGGVGGARYGGDGGSGPKVHIVRHTIGIGGCKEMIMGRGGQTMGSLRKSTGARIKIQNDGVSVSIAGTQTQVDEAIKLVRAIITRGSRPTVCPMLGGGGGGSGGNGQRSNDFATRTMATGGAQNDEIIGAGGMTINILRQRTGANIQAIRSGTSVTITGTLMQVNQATSLVQAIISRGSGPTLYPPGAGAGGGVGVGYQQVFPPRGR